MKKKTKQKNIILLRQYHWTKTRGHFHLSYMQVTCHNWLVSFLTPFLKGPLGSKLTKLSWRWDFSLIFHKYSWNPILICVNHELPPTESLCYIQILFRNAYDNSYVHIFHGWLVKVKIFYYVRWRQTCYDIFLIICCRTTGTGGPGVPFSPKNP